MQQVPRHDPGVFHFLNPGCRRRHQDVPDAGSPRCLYVCSNIAHVGHFARFHSKAAAGIDDHSGGGLPASTVVFLPVRAHFPDVERSEQLIDPPIDCINLAERKQAARNAGLVARHAGGQSRRADPFHCRPGMIHGPHEPWIAVIRHIDNQRSIAVKQDRFQRSSSSHTRKVPHFSFAKQHSAEKFPSAVDVRAVPLDSN